MHIQMTLTGLYHKIPLPSRIAAITAFVVGLISNLFIFTNKCVNHDDLLAEFSYNDTFDVECGRFMWLILRKIPTYYGVPLVKGLLAMLLLAAAMALLVLLLDLKESVFVVVLSAIFATYPINACFFSYMAISEIYYFGIFFAVLSVWLTCLRPAFLSLPCAAVALCCALGSYQSMLCLVIGIVFVMSFRELLSENFRLKQWFFRYCKFALTAVMGFLLYRIVIGISLRLYDTTLRTYAGTDEMFTFHFNGLLQSIRLSYSQFFHYFFTTDIIQHKSYLLLNILLAAVALIIIFVRLFRLAKTKQFAEAAVLIAMTAASPVLLNFVYVMVNGKNAPHILMWYSNILFYAFTVTVVCTALRKDSDIVGSTAFGKKFAICTQWLVFLLCMVMTYYGIIISNQLYQRLYYNTKAIDTLCTTIVSQLSALDGWTVEEPVLFANTGSLLNKNYRPAAPFMSELPPYIWIGTDVYPWYTSEHITRYIGLNLHLTLKEYDGTLTEAILNSQEFQEMPALPDNGSVRRISGVTVVKLDS